MGLLLASAGLPSVLRAAQLVWSQLLQQLAIKHSCNNITDDSVLELIINHEEVTIIFTLWIKKPKH